MPLAPALFSITTGLPKIRVALSAKERITPSVEPPAGHGQINLMGLDGKLACAVAGKAMLTAPAKPACKTSRRFNSEVI
jgi:hypothetical protein